MAEEGGKVCFSLRNVSILAAWLVGLWFFFAVVTPRLEALSPAWQHYYDVQVEYDLHSGALYYSDVPVTLEAQSNMREAVKRGMQVRMEAAQRER